MISALRNLSSRNKSLLHHLGRRLGLEIRLSGPSARADLRLAQMLELFSIDQVLDLGANRGQFARELFAAGYQGKIVSFEPIPDAHSELVDRATGHARWTVADRMALSDVDGVTSFNINNSDTTSSLLNAADDTIALMPGVAQSHRIEVPTRMLDGLIPSLCLKDQRSFVKIDVQGGEGLVLAGARNALNLLSGLLVEVSLCELYENQPIAFDIIRDLRAYGYDVWDIVPNYRNPIEYRLLQFDVVKFHPERTLCNVIGF